MKIFHLLTTIFYARNKLSLKIASLSTSEGFFVMPARHSQISMKTASIMPLNAMEDVLPFSEVRFWPFVTFCKVLCTCVFLKL